jgi:hypothetical protein
MSTIGARAPVTLPAPAGVSVFLHAALLLIGCAVNGMAYERLDAILFGPVVLLAAYVPLALWDNVARARGDLAGAFARIYCVGWFMAGIAAAYAHWAQDPFQLDSDAWGFFQLASGAASGLDLEDIRELSEGAGAVVLWRSWYDLAAEAGIERMRFVGIAFNTMLVALSAAVAVQCQRLMFGDDARRRARLLLMFSTCAILWIFASIHLRDAVVLVAVTLTIHAWLRFLRIGGVLQSVWLCVVLALLTAAFALLRTEFAFVPMVATIIGLASMVLAPSRQQSTRRRWFALILLVVGAVAASGYLGQALEAAGAGRESYGEQVAEEAAQTSLGAQLIVNQPLPIRAIAGSFYLLVFPIPVWAGLASTSALQVFKSLNALFFYALLPLMGMACADLARRPGWRTPERLFVLGMSAVFTLAIALTSLESRHLGSFVVALFLLALVPDPNEAANQRRYRRALGASLATMGATHLVWALAKFGQG